MIRTLSEAVDQKLERALDQRLERILDQKLERILEHNLERILDLLIQPLLQQLHSKEEVSDVFLCLSQNGKDNTKPGKRIPAHTSNKKL